MWQGIVDFDTIDSTPTSASFFFQRVCGSAPSFISVVTFNGYMVARPLAAPKKNERSLAARARKCNEKIKLITQKNKKIVSRKAVIC